MSLIVPTIMAQTTEQLADATNKLRSFTKRVHIALADGQFAPTNLMGPDQLSWPSDWQVDVHMMYKRPSEQLAQIAGLRPAMVVLHAEADEDILPHLNYLRDQGIRAGVALLKTTVPSKVEELIQAADHVMIFSGDLGKFGGTASLMQLEKVRLIRKIKAGVEIGWDGGVVPENAYSLVQGGVDVLNVGGAIQKAGDPQAVFKQLQQEISKTGVLG